MTSKDSVREDIAFIRHAIEQGRGYAGAHSFDLLVWGIALAKGYLGTYATVTGWWRLNPNWLWAVCADCCVPSCSTRSRLRPRRS